MQSVRRRYYTASIDPSWVCLQFSLVTTLLFIYFLFFRQIFFLPTTSSNLCFSAPTMDHIFDISQTTPGINCLCLFWALRDFLLSLVSSASSPVKSLCRLFSDFLHLLFKSVLGMLLLYFRETMKSTRLVAQR